VDGWDYIIVGAGAAGCVLAERLSASGQHQVLVLEAGPADPDPMLRRPVSGPTTAGDDRLWRYPADTGSDTPTYWQHGRMAGGSTAFGSMIWASAPSHDLEAWVRAGASGWGPSELHRCQDWLESQLLDAAGHSLLSHAVPLPPPVQTLREAAVAHGAPEFLVAAPRLLFRHGERIDATLFLDRATARNNVEFRAGWTVQRVLFNGQSAQGVEATPPDLHTAQPLLARREVILCAGPVQSPALLQRSGVGPAELLRDLGITVRVDLPEVGEHLWTHAFMTVHLARPQGSAPLSGWRRRLAEWHYRLDNGGPYARPPWQLMATLPSTHGPLHDSLMLAGCTPGGSDSDASSDGGMTIAVAASRPTSEGSVQIRSPFAKDPPRVVPCLLQTDTDQRSARSAVEWIERLLGCPPIQDLDLSPVTAIPRDPRLLGAWIGEQGLHGQQAGGSNRIGRVLDARLRVHGVRGLRVADASALPGTLSVPCQATVMALAVRAAELIDRGG